MLEHHLIPLAPYVLMALGFLVCIFLTLSTDSELRRLKSTLGGRRAAEARSLGELEKKVAELSERLREAEERAGMLTAPEPPKSGLNVNKRTQVLRLSRRGEQTENIVALLGIPRREVELLIKVNALAVPGRGG